MFKITPKLLNIWISGPADENGQDPFPIPDEGYDPLNRITTEACVRVFNRLTMLSEDFEGINEFDLEFSISNWSDENGGKTPTDEDLIEYLLDDAYVGEYLGCEFERDDFGSKRGLSRFQQMLLEESLAILKERQS